MWRTLLSFLLAFQLLSFPAQAEWAMMELKSFNGGLNDSTDPINIAPNEASDLQDVIFPRVINSSVSSRAGYTRINSTAISGTPTCTGSSFWKLNDTTTRYIISVWTDGKIRRMGYNVGGGASGSFTDITGSLSFSPGQNNLADFAIAQNQIVIEDGINTTPPYVYTGSGNASALGGSPPNATMCEYHSRIMFLAGNNTNPSYLYFSNLNDIATWTATDFIRVETDSADGIIRGLKSGLDSLYIWKDSSIWRLSGTNRDDFRLERMVQGIGTLSNASISVVNNPATNEQLFFFVNQNGDVCVYDGGITVDIISHKIASSFPNALNFSRIQYASSTSYAFNYVVSVSNAAVSTHNRLYLYDIFHKAWTRFTGMNANALFVFEDANGKPLLGFGDYSGRLNQWDITDTTTLNDPATTAVNAYLTTGWYAFSEVGNLKRLRAMKIFANQEGTNRTLDVEVRSDFDASGTTSSVSLAGSGALWDTAVWDTDKYADLAVTIGRIEPDKGDNVFLFKFSNGNRTTEAFKLRKVQVFLEPSGRV